MANDENKIILEFPATNVEIEFGETITFDNISGFLNSDRVTYNGESLTEEIAHLENGIENINNKIASEYDEEETYYRGDIVLYNGVLYECDNTDASGEFNPSDWKEITLGEGIEDVRDLLANYYTKSQSDLHFLGKTNPSGTGYFSLNRRGSTGAYSVSVGWHNEASAQSSFAEGENNASSGYASHSEGYGNAASGLMAHAEGVTTESSGYASHSEGVGTIANHIGQHVFGAYNVADPSTAQPTAKGNYIEIVGNGTDDDRRRNARTLDWQGNEMLMGDLTYNGNKSLTSEISRLDGRIDNLPSPMIFKGTLGVGGTIQSLPAASASNEGYTYKVITEGTYAGQTAKVGDVFTSNGSAWVLIPSGDEDNDTWRAIKVEGVEVLGNGISSGAVDFVGSDNIEIEYVYDGDGKIKTKTKNIYTKAQVDDIVYNIMPDDTASGSVANFETDLALPLKSLEVDVNAKQDLHGYDYPWVAGGGKNLFAPYTERTSNNGINYSVNSNGTIRCQGTSTGVSYSGSNLSYANAPILLKAGTYTISANGFSATGGAQGYLSFGARYSDETLVQSSSIRNNSATITLEEDAHCFYWIYVANNRTINEDIAIQVEAGSTATDWTPYENICPIEGWSAIKIVHTGKNFVPTQTLVKRGNQFFVGNNEYSIFLKAGTYTIRNLGLSRYTYIREKNDTSNTVIHTTNTNVGTFTLPKDGFYNIWFYDATATVDDFYDIQLELGSTATAYEPYVGNEYIINLGGTYYGGHFTQDKDGHRQFEVTHGYITLDGTQDISVANWRPFSNTIGWVYPYNLTNNKFVKANEFPNMKCEELPICKYGSLYEQDIIGIGVVSSNYGLAVRVAEPTLTTKSAINEYLANNPIHACYELATPYSIDLPDGEPIITLNGTNNIYADTGDTSVVFKDSVNGYVEKKIASVQALALNT